MTEKVKSCSDKRKETEYIMYLLSVFYVQPYDETQDFYVQFYSRLANARKQLK